MPFKLFRKRHRHDDAANALYVALVGQARQTVFYAELGVADSLEGRYDMIVLHAFLVFRRLGRVGSEAAKELSQQTFDFMFTDLDQNLREMGVTDMGIGKRVKRMAEAFYGRAGAYDSALENDGPDLADALRRNLYQQVAVGEAVLARMSAYVRAQAAHLDGQDEAALLAGRVSFLPPAPEVG